MSKLDAPPNIDLNSYDFIIKSGRVLVYPVYKGALERFDNESFQTHLGPSATRQFADYMIEVVKDFERSLDYLETRSDIDQGEVGYCGVSEGGIWAPMLLAVAGGRVKVSVLHLGGFINEKCHPLIDYINYVTRVRTPTLKLNGRYDTNLTLEQEVEPMYQLLGTPARDKKLEVFETDHFIPKSDLTRETLAWFDKSLGIVQ